jgi:hypothetical protein
MKATNAPAARNGAPDYRGWFYRAIALDPDAPVFEAGAPFAENWFSNVDSANTCSLRDQHAANYAMVILHATLGGCASITEALIAARTALITGGVVALAGANRIATTLRSARAERYLPTATPWGYRRAARRAGFACPELFVVQPDLDQAACVVSMARPSASAFFRHEAAGRKASGRSRFPWVRSALATSGVAAYLQAFFVMVARKC